MKIFTLPNDRDRQVALGALGGSPFLLRKAITSYTEAERKHPPRPDDWLSTEYEAGQTFDQYRVYVNRIEGSKNKLYIQPLDPGLSADFLYLLQSLCSVFFPGLKFPVKRFRLLSSLGVSPRDTLGGPQYSGGQLLSKLRSITSLNRYGVIGVTMADLFDNEEGNFVYGLANVVNKTGVFSFARYHPQFYGEESSEEQAREVVLMRAAKVMLHEIGHMLGMLHCIYYECLMNGSNNIEETDSAPLHLCPVCFRKLHFCLDFHPIDWYTSLGQFYASLGGAFQAEAEWHQGRANAIVASLPKTVGR